MQIYARSYDPQRPVIYVNKQPVQFIKETRIPLPAQPGQLESVDYEYEHNCTANIFMVTEPANG